STQHYENYDLEEVRAEVKKHVLGPVLDDSLFTDETRVLINPTGRFVVGGPQGDTGLTGRKIICDTYGGFGHHGGGAFSGKDPTKVDRTASYAARFIAKNLVAAGLCSQCEVQLAYAIGVAQPVSLTITNFGTGTVSDEAMENLVRKDIDLRPAALIERFDMLRPIYQQVSNYGHFGRPDLDLPWEKLDLAERWA
ncbi:MAG: methionine adenosyltransferase domain-containing protein, partial [Fastidiosipila sp.]|nr:methionine adenosyltransferase domain-containing protein [Fastidiosipila sp.]